MKGGHQNMSEYLRYSKILRLKSCVIPYILCQEGRDLEALCLSTNTLFEVQSTVYCYTETCCYQNTCAKVCQVTLELSKQCLGSYILSSPSC